MRRPRRLAGSSCSRLRLLVAKPKGVSAMTHDDVLFGYRVQLFALAGEVGVAQACRLMGVHRSTYYRWKPEVERAGLEVLRPRERRRPQMPNQLSALVERSEGRRGGQGGDSG